MKYLRLGLLLACLSVTPLAMAQGNTVGAATADEALLAGENFAGFVESHPDLRSYRRGLDAYRAGDMVNAYRHFRTAARYSDKPSQAIIAEMHWRGQGVERNRPLAYAWMDLAAERGNRRLLVQREQFWEALDQAERAQALELGEQLYAEFGDEVAQPRLETALRWSKRRSIGGKTGFVGNTQIIAPVPGLIDTGAAKSDPNAVVATMTIPASAFYDSKYWDPKEYYAWRERLWELEVREILTGQVEVGEVEKVRSAD